MYTTQTKQTPRKMIRHTLERDVCEGARCAPVSVMECVVYFVVEGTSILTHWSFCRK